MNSFEHFDRFFVLAIVGIGFVCVGVVNLALGAKRRRRFALRVLLSLAICGTAVAVLQALTRGELAARAAGLLGTALAAALLVTASLGSAWVQRRAATLVVVLWGLLTASGLALAVGSMIGFERADDALAEEGAQELDIVLGRPAHRPAENARAVTDRGRAIVLKVPLEARDGGVLSGPEERFLRNTKLADKVIRHGAPTDISNCHGWVFTGGKFLLSPDDVEAILKDNGYTETHEPQPGDVAIYRQNGAIAHTAIVRYVTEGQPTMVEGKWGTLGVFLHGAEQSLYGTDFTFHRSERRGHLLVGVGGISPDPNIVVPVITE